MTYLLGTVLTDPSCTKGSLGALHKSTDVCTSLWHLSKNTYKRRLDTLAADGFGSGPAVLNRTGNNTGYWVYFGLPRTGRRIGISGVDRREGGDGGGGEEEGGGERPACGILGRSLHQYIRHDQRRTRGRPLSLLFDSFPWFHTLLSCDK